MTPRQRRGVLLLFVAGIGAILVFSLVSGYVSDVRKDVEPKTARARADARRARAAADPARRRGA